MRNHLTLYILITYLLRLLSILIAFLGITIAMVMITGCGDMGFSQVDNGKGNGKGNGLENEMKLKEGDNNGHPNTVYRHTCVQYYQNTKFIYVAITFPNGDADTYCEINWLGHEQYSHASGHRYADKASCFIERSYSEYWRFYLQGSSARVEWSGLQQPEDPTNHGALPFSFSFDYCGVESFDDPKWYESYYPFNERNL